MTAHTPRQRNCLAWFQLHEPRQTMSGLKAAWTFDARTLDSLVRCGDLVFTPGDAAGTRINGVYRCVVPPAAPPTGGE